MKNLNEFKRLSGNQESQIKGSRINSKMVWDPDSLFISRWDFTNLVTLFILKKYDLPKSPLEDLRKACDSVLLF